jgi:hypothetical protein
LQDCFSGAGDGGGNRAKGWIIVDMKKDWKQIFPNLDNIISLKERMK